MISFPSPDRLSVREAMWCAKRGIASRSAILREVRRMRLRNLRGTDIVNGRRAAWVLCVPSWHIRNYIASGRLPAQQMWENTYRYHWQIRSDDVEALAEELDQK